MAVLGHSNRTRHLRWSPGILGFAERENYPHDHQLVLGLVLILPDMSQLSFCMVLQASHQHVRKELGRTSQQLTDSIASVGGLDDDLAAAKARYTYMQEVRGYIADLCDMLQVRP